MIAFREEHLRIRLNMVPKRKTVVFAANSSSDMKVISKESTSSNGKIIISKNPSPEVLQTCFQCRIKRKISYLLIKDGIIEYICQEDCLENCKSEQSTEKFEWLAELSKEASSESVPASFLRRCYICKKLVPYNFNITWQGMDFCNELCLLESQLNYGSHCLHCCASVPLEALGQFCKLWGSDIRQFCSSNCQTQHEMNLEMCCNCLQDVTRYNTVYYDEEKLFCSLKCKKAYALIKKGSYRENVDGKRCINCDNVSAYLAKYDSYGFATRYVCSQTCFDQFRKKWMVAASVCFYCKNYTPEDILHRYRVFYNNLLYLFCSAICRKRFLNDEKKIVQCKNCNSEKNIFDMVVKYTNQIPFEVCNLDCLGLFRAFKQQTFIECFLCHSVTAEMFQVLLSNGIIGRFCSIMCLYNFKYNDKSLNETKITKQKNLNEDAELMVRKAIKAMLFYAMPLEGISPSCVQDNLTCGGKCKKEMETDPVILMAEESPAMKTTTANVNKTKKSYSKRTKTKQTKKSQKRTQTNVCKRSKVKTPWHIKKMLAKANDTHIKASLDIVNQQPGELLQIEDTIGEGVKPLCGLTIWTIWATVVVGYSQPDILKLTPKGRRDSLSAFVRYYLTKNQKRIKYSSDTCYYICLSLQKYLQEHSCEDALFHDRKYSDFRKMFNLIAEKFHRPSSFDKFKVEENHLWETMQLGNHCPEVLLFTLMYYFAKNCHSMTKWTSHKRLSLKQLATEFSEIDCPSIVTVKLCDFREESVENIRFILLKNDDNPMKCPVRLCQLYLEKCPMALKSYDQFFYLKPAKKFNSDDPLWFTTNRLSEEIIRRNLNLIKMVKEISI